MPSRARLEANRSAPTGPAPARRANAAAPAPEEPEGSSTERIVRGVTQAIVERRLMPGTKLAEQRLADIYGVSRTIVRQALNQLSRDKLITLEPARGARVAEPGVEEARQVFEVRRMLESALARSAASVLSPAQIAELRRHLRQEEAAVRQADIGGRTHLLADFHVVLARMTGNEVLAELLADLVSRCSLIALMYQSSHSAGHSHAEHVALVDALERRDARAAARLMEEHLRSVEQNLKLEARAPDLAGALVPPAKETR